MIRTKACPRCRGDLYLEIDAHFTNRVCLQCGYRSEIKSVKRDWRELLKEIDRQEVCAK